MTMSQPTLRDRIEAPLCDADLYQVEIEAL
jgi:hypothetical protein